jgi:hypothetical protein
MFYAADSAVTAINFKLLYGTESSSAESPLNLDLAALGHNALAIDFKFANFANDGGYLDIRAGRYAYTPIPNSASPFRVIHPFSATPDAGTGNIRSIWLGTSNGYLFGEFAISRISTISTADFNADGNVDGQDFLIWQRNLGAQLAGDNAARITRGDADLDGTVDGMDLELLKAAIHRATHAAETAARAPEPTVAILAALALVLGRSYLR